LSEGFQKRLERQLSKNGISLEDLCSSVNIDASALRLCFENDTPPDNFTLEKIADYFDVSPEKLYSGYDTQNEATVQIQIVGTVGAKDNTRYNKKTVGIPAYIAEFGTFEAYIAGDDTMSPDINKDDTVIICRQNYASSGDIVLCEVNGKVMLLKIKQLSLGFVLYSLSKDINPVFVAKADIDSEKYVKILGRVAQVIKKERKNERKS